MTQSTPRTALIIGATGSFGGHAAVALIKRGWRVRALARDPEAAARKTGAHTPIEWLKGDAMNAADVLAASEGADVIVHGANPPGYKNWRGLAVPMLDNTIAAAIARLGQMREIPVRCYKAVSDGLAAELPDLNPFINASGQLEMGRFLGHVALRPQYWGALATLGRHSDIAARAIAVEVKDYLQNTLGE